MSQSEEIGALPFLGAWAATAAAYTAKALLTSATTPLLLDTDDAMRLTEVRDFLNGQNWFDLVEHRLNTPYGGLIHWSRLIDLPEAIVIGLLRLPFGAGGDLVAAYVWPLLLLGPLLWLSTRLAMRLGGREALVPGLLLPAFSLVTLAEFAPGRFDHHSAQILLTLVMLWGALDARINWRWAIAAGVAAAAGLAIGIESAPMVAATVVVFGLNWVVDPRQGTALRDFGLSFAAGTALALAQGVPPGRWLAPMLDGISIVYAVAATLCGFAFVGLSLSPLRSWGTRLAAGCASAVVLVAAVVVLWPSILKGPYGMLDPWLTANWLDHISEAQPWLTSLVADPVYPVAVAVPAVLALCFALGQAIRNKDRQTWLIYGAVLLAMMLVTLTQIRAARMATPIAVPGCSALIAAAWRTQSSRRGIVPALAVVGSWIASAGVAVGVLATLVVLAFPDYAAATDDTARGSREACLMPEAFADLARLPPARIMAPVDLGSHLLLFTAHSVVAAPYHRNQEALLDAFHFFNEPIADARAILERRGVTLVVICPAMKEVRGLVDHAPDSFVALYAAGRLPAWLKDESTASSPLKVYAVQPE